MFARNVPGHVIPIILLALMIHPACSSEQPQSERVGEKSSGSDSDDFGSSDSKKKSSKKKPKKSSSNNGADDFEDEEEEEDEGGDSASVPSCRKFSDDFSTQTEIAGQVAVPILGNMNFKVDADADVSIESSGTKGSVKIDGTITNATPALAKSTAQKALDAYADPMRLKILTPDQQNDISGLEGMDCAVLAISSLESKSFAYEFEPALPFLASPEADGATSTEISVTSKLLRHYDTANGAKPGTYKGKARVSKNGSAIRIDFDFGSGVPNIYAAPFAGVEFKPDGSGGFSVVTAWVWITADTKLPVVLEK